MFLEKEIAEMEETLVQSEYEVERGKPMPSKNHSIIQRRLVVYLDTTYGDRFEIMPEINLDPPNTRDRVPDIGIFPPQQFVPDEDEIRMTQTPFGLIEILSPKQDIAELQTKCAEYFKNGIQSYWLVIPSLRTIYVFESTTDYEVYAKKEILKDNKLGIELPLAEVFK